ncbi:DNA mismatch repair endonuclease MutH [Paraglaciecola marina]|uniref:DNA mismatch repair endonuclease MutH n=1 Tax=Paraglaciecola marina TaxID=2500157 RepID=UPI0010605E1C|nr:DNA mismatch repair endonuclease MutH [Paraglaciecola marina]
MKQFKLLKSEPNTLDELLIRAETLAGLTLGEVAEIANIKVPSNFKREKGWTGQLIETCLGASAGSKTRQDFAKIGVELKTIPIDKYGHPLETTYVCYAHLTQIAGIEWSNSNVKNKLQQVLWVPIQGERTITPANRIIGTPFLWALNNEQEKQLQQDWEELMDMIALGNIEEITARHGQYLQLRPKAANGSAVTTAVGKNGQSIQTRPRGFYLKKDFTQQILDNRF